MQGGCKDAGFGALSGARLRRESSRRRQSPNAPLRSVISSCETQHLWQVKTGVAPWIITYFIESRDPFESNDVVYYYELAKGLVEAGNQVTLLLVQNGVLAARPSAHSATASRRLVGAAWRSSPMTSH